MDSDFNSSNVRRLAYAVGSYLAKKGTGSVIVGYDTRRNSDEFSKDAAHVLSSFGFNVRRTSRPTPTPVVAFSVANTHALAAVQITASHNPPVYNGFKFIPDYAGPAFPEITLEIEALLPEHEVIWHDSGFETFDPKPAYFEFVRKNVRLEGLHHYHIVTDPLYGAGYGYLSDLLSQAGARVEEIHSTPDPDFGGLSPEPNERNTKELAQAVIKRGADLGIANDGDADRFAAIDRRGRHYSSNMLVLVIVDYLLKSGKLGKKIARSVSTTSKLDLLVSRWGVQVVETPVGFKHLARELMSGATLAAEESGGLGFGWSVPEKDGIMSGALLCEALSSTGTGLDEYWETLTSELGEYHYAQYNLPATQELKNKIEALRTKEFREFAGVPVRSKVTIDGLKLVLEDGSWVLFRPSGTEPYVRLYIEAEAERSLEHLKSEAELLLSN